MAQLFLHDTQVLRATQQRRAVRVPERVRMQLRHGGPHPGELDELPDPLATDPPLDPLANLRFVHDHEEGRADACASPLRGHVVAQDGVRRHAARLSVLACHDQGRRAPARVDSRGARTRSLPIQSSVVPSTDRAMLGLVNAEDRRDVIDYLEFPTLSVIAAKITS